MRGFICGLSQKPGNKLALETVSMHFHMKSLFETKGLEAYEKVLTDIFNGDQMLFNRSDELASSWNLLQKFLRDGARSLGQI